MKSSKLIVVWLLTSLVASFIYGSLPVQKSSGEITLPVAEAAGLLETEAAVPCHTDAHELPIATIALPTTIPILSGCSNQSLNSINFHLKSILRI
jgi:hypothetical protein